MTIVIIFLPEYPQIICPQNILLSNAVNILCKDDSGDIFKQHFQGHLNNILQWTWILWRVIIKCESWTIKKAEHKELMLLNCGVEKTLESPLDCKEIQPVHTKGDQSWVFIERTDTKAEIPVLWPPHAKSWLIGKDSDAGKDWGQEEKGTTEDEMVGWHHRLDGHGFGWTPGVGDGQGGLVCCSSWGRKKSDMTERLNWTELNYKMSEVRQRRIKETFLPTYDSERILKLAPLYYVLQKTS